ncbi:MAG: sigma-70 family RNA polymerase sigma factor [Lachnospiraceae bacterium]|nr:sigma-70 family RNA polymerase sigma factor [Lachnospiraceae bacterium]
MITSDKDKDKIAELYEKYRHRLWYCARWLVGESEAEDVVQSVILEILERRTDLSKYSLIELYTYTLTLTKSRCVDILRKRAQKKMQSYEQLIEAGIERKSVKTDPEQEVIAQDALQLLAQMIGDMKPEYQELVHYRFYENMTSRQIAAQIHSSENLVDKRISRIRHRIRTRLKEAGYSV